MNINKDTIEDITIYKVISGSQAYGTNNETSDTDIRGIAIVPDKEYYFGFTKNFEQYLDSTSDTQIYDIRKFFNLAAKCNPSVVELLFITKPECILLETKWSNMIKDNRKHFLSMAAKSTFLGYATDQLKKVKTHRNWLLNPPSHYPIRDEFGLKIDQSLSYEKLQAMNKLINDGNLKDINVIEYIKKENEYRNACQYYSQYENWVKTRNPKRAELEAKYGYDCKGSLHLCRLLLTGYELITTGELNVHRHDADFLISIKNGAWTYDQLMTFATDIENKYNVFYEDKSKWILPDKPDINFLNSLCTTIVDEYLKENCSS